MYPGVSGQGVVPRPVVLGMAGVLPDAFIGPRCMFGAPHGRGLDGLSETFAGCVQNQIPIGSPVESMTGGSGITSAVPYRIRSAVHSAAKAS